MELKKGYKQTEVGVIPDVWKIMTIDQIFEFHSTSNYSKAQMLTNGEIGCFHYGLIHSLPNNNYDIRTGVKYFVTKQQAKYEFIKEGDVVMVDASEDLSGVNKSIEISGVQDKLYISGLHTYLLRDRGFFEKNFRGPILNSHFTKAQFYRLAVGMKVFGVSKQQLKTVLLPIPTKSEQTAIANALSDTDAYITSLEKLIAKKRQTKLVAMQ
jgi:type I restriction enzyme S subunit